MTRSRPSWLTDDLAVLDDTCGLPLDRPFTGEEVRALGISRWFQRLLLRRGLVKEVLPRVYAAAQLPETIELKAAALRLVIPDTAVVTDRTAAWLHGVDILPPSAVREPPPLDVYSRSGSRLRRPQVDSGLRMLGEDDIMEVDGVLVTTPLRTALDLGRLLRRFEAIAALDGFLRIGVPRDHLLLSIERFKGFRGVVQLRCLAPLADGRAESPPESALRLHWIDVGLPMPEPQWWVHDERGFPLFRIDLALPACRFGAEYQGERFHTGEAAEQRDAERAVWLQEREGWTLAFFGKKDLYGPGADPGARLVEGVRRARLELGGWRPQSHFL